MAATNPPGRTRAAWMQALPAVATFVLLILAVACVYWARPVLIPTALATLLTFLLAPVVTWLQRRGLPRAVAVVVVVVLAGLLLTGLAWVVGSQVVQLAADLPAYEQNVTRRIADLREQGGNSALGNVQRFIHGVTTALARPTPAAAVAEEATVPVTVVDSAAGFTWWLQGLGPLAEPIATAGLVVVLVIYLLLRREDLRDRVLALVGRGQLTVTTKALDDAGRRISRYLLAQFCLNLAFGVVIGAGLFVLGVPHAVLWGFLAGLLRYIPYIGPWLAASLPVTVSLLLSPGWLLPIGVVALFVVSELISNLVVEPLIYGQSIGVSQAALIISIAFWTWLWGPLGLILAAPLTVCLVVLGKFVPALKFFDILLGDEPVLAPGTTYYQRLLARDEDEAAQIIEEQAKTKSAVTVCDDVLLPALVAALCDRQAEQLEDEDYYYVCQAVEQTAIEAELDFAADRNGAGRNSKAEVTAGPPLSILACATRNGSDTTALALLERLVDPVRVQLEIISSQALVSEVVELAAERKPAALLIAALPPGGLGHTRHFVKRLRQRLPELKILVGRWGDPLADGEQHHWTANADYVATTFATTLAQFAELTQFLRVPQSTAAADREAVPAVQSAASSPPRPHAAFAAAKTSA